MRRRRPPEPPAPPPPPPEPPAEEPRTEVVGDRGERLSSPDLQRRRAVARRLMTLGVTLTQLVDAMHDQGWEVTPGQARGDYEHVMREFSEHYDAGLPHARAAMAARLAADLPRLRREAATAGSVVMKKGRPVLDPQTGLPQVRANHQARAAYWREVTAHEQLLARLLGLNAPVKVQVTGEDSLRDGYARVIAGMSGAELEAMADEQLLLEQRVAKLPEE